MAYDDWKLASPPEYEYDEEPMSEPEEEREPDVWFSTESDPDHRGILAGADLDVMALDRGIVRRLHENDAMLRMRLMQQFSAPNTGTRASVEQAVSSVPGVRRCRVEDVIDENPRVVINVEVDDRFDLSEYGEINGAIVAAVRDTIALGVQWEINRTHVGDYDRFVGDRDGWR